MPSNRSWANSDIPLVQGCDKIDSPRCNIGQPGHSASIVGKESNIEYYNQFHTNRYDSHQGNDTPHVPVTVQEIVENVHQAIEIGITMVHLHARDEQSGQPTFKAELYGKIIGGIRKFSRDLVICVSLSGRTFPEFEKRAAPLSLDGSLKPDMGSLTLSSLNFNKQASISSPDMIIALAREMRSRNILPELEAFDAGMINYAKYLESKGLLEPPHYFSLILGNIACAQADLLHAGVMLRDLPPNSFWSMGGVGDSQLMVNSIGIAAGGGAMVGLEDNIWYDTARTRLASNADSSQDNSPAKFDW
jgi:3-keto-5-aminohexanoate cleavage enzyme